ncbi:MAG: hypothetical protein SGPRY_001264 [Prymnesium sp.]
MESDEFWPPRPASTWLRELLLASGLVLLCLPGLALTFAGFPYPAGREGEVSPDERPSARDVHAYLHRFAEARGLLERFRLSSQVVSVSMEEGSRRAKVGVRANPAEIKRGAAPATNEGESTRFEGPFDMVVYASITSHPFVPSLPGSFEGHACHACELNESLLASIAGSTSRVLVIGAGRSGCDVVLSLLRAGVGGDRFTWLLRRPYFFWKLERCWHRCSQGNKRGLLPRLRAFAAAIAFWMCGLAPGVGWRLFWALDYVFTPHVQCERGAVSEREKWCSDPAFHMGLLDATQRRALSQVHETFAPREHNYHICDQISAVILI